METLRPRLQSRDECADRAPDARPSGGALARQQLFYWLLLRKRGPLPPVCASRTNDGAWRESRVDTVATADFDHGRSGFRTARVPPLGLYDCRHLNIQFERNIPCPLIC